MKSDSVSVADQIQALSTVLSALSEELRASSFITTNNSSSSSSSSSRYYDTDTLTAKRNALQPLNSSKIFYSVSTCI